MTNFAHLSPQALHNVFGPLGPFLHSGLSRVPQSVQTYSSAIFCFFFFSEVWRLSLSIGIGTPASPRISAGDVSPVLMPFDRSPSRYRNPVNISIVSIWVAPSNRAILSRILSAFARLDCSMRSRFCRVRAAEVCCCVGFAGGGIWSNELGVCAVVIGVSLPMFEVILLPAVPLSVRAPGYGCLCRCCCWCSSYSSFLKSLILFINRSFSILCSRKESRRAAFRVGYGLDIMKKPLHTDCMADGPNCGASPIWGWPFVSKIAYVPSVFWNL